MNKPRVVLVDMDNCFMDSRELIAKYSGEWSKFAENIHKAMPNHSFINGLIDLLNELGVMPIFVTGREDRQGVLETTISQIETYSKNRFKVGENCYVFLRLSGDTRKADLVKKDILADIRNHYDPIIAFDDDVKVCAMYKENGLITFCYNIEEDDFERV